MGFRESFGKHFIPKPDVLSGEECPACHEDRNIHNKARNRACSSQLGKDKDGNQIKNFPDKKVVAPATSTA